jgi:hypothetical protein
VPLKDVTNNNYLDEISLVTDNHLHISNETEDIHTANQVELIINQGESTETLHLITNQEISYFHNHMYRDT